MTEFSLAELKLLAAQDTAPCISIYMPVDRTNTRPKQEIARLNHFLKQAEEQLMAKDMRRPDAEAFLAPVRELINSDGFWQQPRDGIALFLAPNFFRYFDDNSMAIAFVEQFSITDHFQIKPLLPLLTDNGQFYILALDQKQIRLLHGTRDTITAIQLEGAPHDIHEALGEQMADTETQGRPMDVGDHHEKFGAYDPTQKDKDRILRYFRVVNSIVHKYLADKQAPLILAGMEYDHTIYHEANTYPHLLDKSIAHSSDGLSAKALHELAWKIIEPTFQQAREQALERFYKNVSHGKSSDKLVDILEAAHVGRVDTLFVLEGKQRFGKFDLKTIHLEELDEQSPDSVDLIDEAAAQTILNSGTVYVIPAEMSATMPDLPEMPAALLRY